MAKLSLCRTAALGGRVWECPQCQHRGCLYNSCGDRHCPQCGGARRSAWLDKTAELLLPRINYFQVVFTLPAEFSRLTLGNRRVIYGLLMRASWQALRDVLQEDLGIQPAALLVLHTWNQELDHHPHVHALVPGGGPSRDGKHWIHARHPKHHRRSKPYLVDNRRLGEKFKQQFCAGLQRLHRRGELQFGPLSLLREYRYFAAWLEAIAEKAWNVFIEAPPPQARPAQVLKYLARYLTGGPICDHRLLAHEDGQVTFWARSKNKQTGNRPRPLTLSGVEFTRRWSMHILPKGFTKVRCGGGFSSRRRADYLQRCGRLLKIAEAEHEHQPKAPLEDDDELASRRCPDCQGQMVCVTASERPSWRDLFADYRTCPWWYPALGYRPPPRLRAPP